jgi:hypothetical protein
MLGRFWWLESHCSASHSVAAMSIAIRNKCERAFQAIMISSGTHKVLNKKAASFLQTCNIALACALPWAARPLHCSVAHCEANMRSVVRCSWLVQQNN